MTDFQTILRIKNVNDLIFVIEVQSKILKFYLYKFIVSESRYIRPSIWLKNESTAKNSDDTNHKIK